MVESRRLRLILALISHGARAALIFFDKKEHQSFSFAEQGCIEFRKTINYSVPVALIGIQSDDVLITKEQGQALASKYKSSYYEITSSDCKQVEGVFLYLTYKAFQKIAKNYI